MLPAAALVFGLMVAPTAQSFVLNLFEFDLLIRDLVLLLTLVWLVASIPTGLAPHFSGRLRPVALAALAGLAALALIESQFLGAAYAPLAGGALFHKNPLGSPWGNTGVWLGVGIIFAAGARPLLRNARQLLFGIAGLQAAYLVLAVVTAANNPGTTSSRIWPTTSRPTGSLP